MSQIEPHILKLISQYTTQEISKAEFDQLQQWLNASPENKILFTEFLQLYKKSRQISFASHLNKEKAWNTIVSKLETPLQPISNTSVRKVFSIRNTWFRYAAAAVVFGIMTTVYFYKNNSFTEDKVVNANVASAKTEIEIGSNKATLTLEDGSVVTLQKGDNYQTNAAQSNGEQIVYDAENQNSSKIAYNYLTIPRGGEFHLVLSDGTKVWLNSETQLKYPVAFNEGVLRQVELVYGEAFFEVSPSTKHKGAKFKVLNKSQDVEVLGTQFNIKAYRDETNVFTTLIEGKVAVNYSGKNKFLKPSEQSNFDIQNQTMAIATVEVYNEIAWRDGIFSFRKKPLGEIMKVLSRWYDVDFQFANEEIKKSRFNGVLGKDQKIEDILKIIKNFKVINDYEIINKKIILK